jgi:integrase
LRAVKEERAGSTAPGKQVIVLFKLIQKTGLRISEAIGLKVQDMRIVDGNGKKPPGNRQGRQRAAGDGAR